MLICCNMLSEVAALSGARRLRALANPPQVRLAEKIESLKEKKEFLTAETTNNREIETQTEEDAPVQLEWPTSSHSDWGPDAEFNRTMLACDEQALENWAGE